MPYYHRGCDGLVPMRWPIKCKKCKKTWPPSTMFKYPTPKDLYLHINPIKPPIGKGDTQYASWGDNIPGVAFVASRMPKWPRWARVLVLVGIIALIIAIVRFARSC